MAPLRVYTDTPFKMTDSAHRKQSVASPTQFTVDPDPPKVLTYSQAGISSPEEQPSGNVTGSTQSAAVNIERRAFFTPDGKQASLNG